MSNRIWHTYSVGGRLTTSQVAAVEDVFHRHLESTYDYQGVDRSGPYLRVEVEISSYQWEPISKELDALGVHWMVSYETEGSSYLEIHRGGKMVYDGPSANGAPCLNCETIEFEIQAANGNFEVLASRLRALMAKDDWGLPILEPYIDPNDASVHPEGEPESVTV